MINERQLKRRKKYIDFKLQQKERIFPFEVIPKGSNVVIYGLGELGTEYISQIQLTNWCNIVAISDQSSIGEEWDYMFCKPDQLGKLNLVDYFVIAITRQEIIAEVTKTLNALGINNSKVISAQFRTGMNEEFLKNDTCSEDIDKLKVLLVCNGGIGDAVMETSFYSELVRMVPNVIIDVWGPKYLSVAYETKKNVRQMIDIDVNTANVKEYDLCLSLGWGIRFWNCNYSKIKNISEELYEKIRLTDKDIQTKRLHIESVIWSSRILGRNKFWIMGRGEIWNLSKEKISVEVVERFQSEYEKLGLKKYITVNCGVDMRRITEENEYPTKMWPIPRFEEFVCLFKKKFQNYEIVQLGPDGQMKIRGVDRYIFGESLELTKYILKNSMLHIDDEGGLVHLATALGTKCVVLFGPTPIDILGYPENINISAGSCKECFMYEKNWNARCVLGDNPPRCMNDIHPELVLEKVEEFINSL